MLQQFKVKNFKSIKDEVLFDMQAISYKENRDSLIIDKNNNEFLPVSALYGPNGGGKSNLLESMFVLKNIILIPIINSDAKSTKDNVDAWNLINPFKFNDSSQNEPTEYFIAFSTDNHEFKYVLHVNKKGVVYEKLLSRSFDDNKVVEYFERYENNVEIFSGSPLQNMKINKDISSNILLMSLLGVLYNNNEVIFEFIDWFSNKFLVLNFMNVTHLRNNLTLCLMEEHKDILVKMLQDVNIKIDDISIEKKDKRADIFTYRYISNRIYKLDIFEESRGTDKICNTLPYVIDSLNEGGTLVIDELDASLHPRLLQYIIELYTSKISNKNGAQLIITSHDLTTMTNDVFRRDEIWFVAQVDDKSSQLYSLADIKDDNSKPIRYDAKYNKQYLEGKYGADPYLRRCLDWKEYYSGKSSKK